MGYGLTRTSLFSSPQVYAPNHGLEFSYLVPSDDWADMLMSCLNFDATGRAEVSQ